jgi:Cadherin domain
VGKYFLCSTRATRFDLRFHTKSINKLFVKCVPQQTRKIPQPAQNKQISRVLSSVRPQQINQLTLLKFHFQNHALDAIFKFPPCGVFQVAKMRAVLQVVVFAVVSAAAFAQQNRAPHFVTGGDMARLSLPEDTVVGTPVYTLRGEDPDGAHVHYSISGQSFAVNRETGVVTLVRPLDREKQDRVEVIISLTGTWNNNILICVFLGGVPF